MGNGMTCSTTLKTGVERGGANYQYSGATPPPPPTGAVGGGGAQHLGGVVVEQTALSQGGFDVVPMPLFLSRGGVAGRGLPLSLPTFWGKIRGGC